MFTKWMEYQVRKHRIIMAVRKGMGQKPKSRNELVQNIETFVLGGFFVHGVPLLIAYTIYLIWRG